MPDNVALKSLIDANGQLIALSVNLEGLKPAMSNNEAQAYFGDAIDFYMDNGVVTGNSPSKIVRIADSGDIEGLR